MAAEPSVYPICHDRGRKIICGLLGTIAPFRDRRNGTTKRIVDFYQKLQKQEL
jgi:hypothetical protein